MSWYVRNNEAEFIERVREASDQRQEETVKDSKTQLAKRNGGTGSWTGL